MSREITCDLHNHTTVSDGEYSPTAIVQLAGRLGLRAIGITDHDSIAGLEEACEAGLREGVTVIPGVEVSLRFRRTFFTGSLHLLLYFSRSRLRDDTFRNALNEILAQGRGVDLLRERIMAINAECGPNGSHPLLERDLTMEEIASYGQNITRRHFALALQEKHRMGDDLINTIIGNDSPAYIPSGVEMGLFPPFFQKYPIVRVLAHAAAGSFPGPNHYREVLPPLSTVERLLPEFIDPKTLGIDGIEVYYPGHTEEHQQILYRWAKQYGLIVTGGSDCHDSAIRPLGVSGMSSDEYDILVERIGSS